MPFAIVGKSRVGDAEAVRAEGFVPGIMYGAGITPVQFSVSSVDLEKIYRNVSESTLVDFTLDGGAPVKVLLQDFQFDPVKSKISHVDFRQIDMSKELEVDVEINLIGIAPAVKALGGTLVQQLDSAQVRCLPKDLISSVEVDVSVLAGLDDIISIADLKFPVGVEPLDAPDTVIARVEAPMTEEEMKALEEGSAVDLSKIEVSEKKGKKEEEGAEAEAADTAKAEEKK